MPSTTQQSGLDATPSFKGKDFNAFYEYLKTNTATATQAAVALGIYRPSACRYKRWLEKDGHLFETGKGTCPITGFTATFLTTDHSYSNSHQIKMF